MEVKAGQVWKSCLTGLIYTVEIVHENSVSVTKPVGTSIDRCAFNGGIFELIKDIDPQLSDLEIVQKALDKTGFDMLCTGGSFVVADHCSEEIGVDGHHFNDMNELLAWAKQTIGID